MFSQSDVTLSSVTLQNLLSKKLVTKGSKFAPTLFCFDLNNNPSCQTLSNALDISKYTTQVCRDGLQSKLKKDDMGDCK